MIYLGDSEKLRIYLGDVEYCKAYAVDILRHDCDDDVIIDPENQPPTMGDLNIYVSGGTTRVITYEDFRDEATPPYNDPENDLMDAIRIDDIDSNNKGTYYLNGVPVSVGMIITREQLINNELTHKGLTATDYITDSLTFSVRDEGNGNWVN
jgi:hypothetical protein